MGLLEDLDNFLLDRVEKFCHWFQLWTGKTNLFLARMTNIVMTIAIFMQVLDTLRANGGRLSMVVWFRYFLIVWLLGYVIYYYDVAEYMEIRRISSSTSNPNKIGTFKKIRMTVIGFELFVRLTLIQVWLWASLAEHKWVVFGAYSWPSTIFIGSVLAWIYLISCDPLPPCTGKISEWVAGFFGKPVQVHSE